MCCQKFILVSILLLGIFKNSKLDSNAQTKSKIDDRNPKQKCDKFLNLTLYYETLCPFSRLFIVKNLVPNFRKFKDNIRVEFIPYGIVKRITKNGKTIDFNQHGMQERILNILSACAFYVVKSSQLQHMKFARCLAISVPDTIEGQMKCANNSEISWDELQKCVNDEKLVKKLNLYLEQKTSKGIQIPNTKFVAVPSVHLNNKWSSAGFSNLTKFVCNYFEKVHCDLC